MANKSYYALNALSSVIENTNNATIGMESDISLHDLLKIARWNLVGRSLHDEDYKKCCKLFEALIEKAKEIENERNE